MKNVGATLVFGLISLLAPWSLWSQAASTPEELPLRANYPQEIRGIYFPQVFLDAFETSGSFRMAHLEGKKTGAHDYLDVQEKDIYSSISYYDGYAVDHRELDKGWAHFSMDGTRFIRDHEGRIYRRTILRGADGRLGKTIQAFVAERFLGSPTFKSLAAPFQLRGTGISWEGAQWRVQLTQGPWHPLGLDHDLALTGPENRMIFLVYTGGGLGVYEPVNDGRDHWDRTQQVRELSWYGTRKEGNGNYHYPKDLPEDAYGLYVLDKALKTAESERSATWPGVLGVNPFSGMTAWGITSDGYGYTREAFFQGDLSRLKEGLYTDHQGLVWRKISPIYLPDFNAGYKPLITESLITRLWKGLKPKDPRQLSLGVQGFSLSSDEFRQDSHYFEWVDVLNWMGDQRKFTLFRSRKGQLAAALWNGRSMEIREASHSGERGEEAWVLGKILGELQP